ncbi:MAG: hypothetical protein DYG94_09415 [Leptolyngbya sp. PLA3]|nr:MAG: hypothetical protein EDM82_11915 [Cyanobacteria bacterium CYA]MCE7968948.1 hypothetical protein [Leptolyngbya sp. PL-A3]
MSKPCAEKADRKPRERRERKRLRPWQKALAVLSVVIALSGVGLMVYAAGTRPEPAPASAGAPGTSSLVQGFAPDGNADSHQPTDGQAQTERLIDSTSGAVFRLGFGFFAGFAVGYAMRMFVRMTLVAAGIAILGLAGLQYAGMIEVDWEKISGGFDTFGAWFTEQTRGLGGFITGYLPTFGAGLAGAFVGFRRV